MRRFLGRRAQIMRVPALAAALTFLASIGPGVVAQQAADPAGEEQVIRDRDRQWVDAVAARDADFIASLYAENGRLLPPNSPIVAGREAIRQWWRGFLELPDLTLTFAPTEIGVAAAGDLAWDTGTYQLSFSSLGGPVSEQGKYLQVWARVGADWQLVADMFSSDLPLP